MSDSIFNPEQFLNTQITGANETSFTPVPIGEWRAQVDKVEGRSFTSKAGDTFRVMEVTWNVLDPSVREVTGMDKPTVRQSIFLDFTESGALEMGKSKNVALGRFRDAIGQNSSGRPWSPSHAVGSTAIVRVKHETNETTGDIRASVDRVAKA